MTMICHRSIAPGISFAVQNAERPHVHPMLLCLKSMHVRVLHMHFFTHTFTCTLLQGMHGYLKIILQF